MRDNRINFSPSPRWSDLFPSLLKADKSNHQIEFPSPSLSFLGSGKGAIATVLSYLRYKDILRDKMSGFLVPPWLGIQVYQTFMEYSFPTQTYSKDCGAILAYHQYGFPQNMDMISDFAAAHSLTIVEDCAHACGTKWKNQHLGTIGDFGIFSFSKYVFCYSLGGVTFRDPNFKIHLDERENTSNRLLAQYIHYFKFFDELNLARPKPAFDSFMTQLRKMAYALYPDAISPSRMAIALWNQKGPDELLWRKLNFKYFIEETKDFDLFQDLPLNDVVPYALPLKVKDLSKRNSILTKIRNLGIEAGIRKFDVNRFFIEPHYEERILLPFHSQLGTTKLNQVIEIIRKNL